MGAHRLCLCLPLLLLGSLAPVDGLRARRFDEAGAARSYDAPAADADGRLPARSYVAPAADEDGRLPTARARLRKAWAEFGCPSKTNKTKLEDSLLEPPITSYSPWVTSIPVYYISMGGQREAEFRASLQSFSSATYRVSAVDGDDHEERNRTIVDSDFVWDRLSHFVKLRSKIMGCLLSHLKAMKEAYDSKAAAVLILEDDAVPLFSGWTGGLEDYLHSLPPHWEAMQLQYSMQTGRISKAGEYAKHVDFHPGKRTFGGGSGWGTSAYVLHRRAMARVMAQMWVPKLGKFNVTALVTRCEYASVDDCLLGFTDRWGDELWNVRWLPGHRKMLTETFYPIPPLFAHHSQRAWMHRENLCQDMRIAQQTADMRRRQWPDRNQSDGPKVLVFMAYPSTNALSNYSVGILHRNAELVEQSLGVQADFFLGVDDGSLDLMPGLAKGLAPKASQKTMAAAEKLLELGRPWGRMLHLLKQSWGKHHRAWEKKYSYVLALDADIDLNDTGVLSRMVDAARRTKSPLVAPAIKTQPELLDELRTFEVPDKNCEFRYTSRVGMGALMMSPHSWWLLLQGCVSCLRPDTTELRMTDWCHFLGRLLKGAEAEGAGGCAVLDATPVQRRDLLTPVERAAVSSAQQRAQLSGAQSGAAGDGGEAPWSRCAPR